MKFSISPAFVLHFLILSFSGLWITIFSFSCLAGEGKATSKAVNTPSNNANSQIVFINPETGELDQDAATASEELTLHTDVKAPAPEQFIYHEDGSVTIDLKGQFMMPLYGQIDSNGDIVLSHDSNLGGNNK